MTGPHDDDQADSPQLSLRKIFHRRQRYSSKMSTLSEISERESSPPATDATATAIATQHEALKRPSLFSVLVGSHLSVYLSEGMCVAFIIVH